MASLLRVSQTASKPIQLILPIVIGTAMHMTLQDKRIGSIASGMGLALAGCNMMAFSGLPKALKAWCLPAKAGENERRLKPTLHIAMASLGLALTCCGIYQALSGVFERSILQETKLHKAFTSPPSSSKQNADGCTLQLSKVQKIFLACPTAQALWQEVHSEGAFTLKCATSAEAPAGGRVGAHKREILISEAYGNMLHALLFELNNLKQAKKALLLGKKKCHLSPNEYARAIEMIEYKTAKNSHKIFEACNKRGFWSQHANPFHEKFKGRSHSNWTSFEGYLETQERLGHTALYRDAWHEECQP